MSTRARRLLATSVAVVASLTALVASGAPALAAAPPGTPTARSFAGTPTVGPIFRDGLGSDHGCTASIVDSPSRDLILTAAHCVVGTAAGWQFAPGYVKGRTPYGVWMVVHAYLDPAWMATQNTQDDFAILQLADQTRDGRTVGVEDVAGGNVVGLAPRAGSRITDIAYNAGINDRPIMCNVPVYYTAGYPGFNCHGYVGGSSGSPWLAPVPGDPGRQMVVGVIGGLHQGGCFEYTSYSSHFATDVQRLVSRASRQQKPDVAPQPGSDGC
jgi:hypothetical protein